MSELITVQEVIEKVRTSNDVTAAIMISVFVQQQAAMNNAFAEPYGKAMNRIKELEDREDTYKSAITSAAERMNSDPLELATALHGGVIAELVEALEYYSSELNFARILRDDGAYARAALAKIPQPKEKTK